MKDYATGEGWTASDIDQALINHGGVLYAHMASQVDTKNNDIPSKSESFEKVNHPSHYKSHPSGIECIQITEHMSFNLGNGIKYIWRADEKGNAIEDLEKAVWYLTREISKRKAGSI